MKIIKLPQIKNLRLCSNCNSYALIKVDPNSNSRGIKLCYKCINILISKLGKVLKDHKEEQ